MKRIILFICISAIATRYTQSQNVFNPADAIVRYSNAQPLGSAQNPDPAKPGLQKWVSTPTVGVSLGSDTYDASSFKQYFINAAGGKMAFRIKFPKTYSDAASAGKKYPIMLFLHGGGEVGCATNGGIYNNEKQVWIGGSLFKQRVDNGEFDGFLLYPQLVVADAGCFAGWGTAPTVSFNAIIAMIDSMGKYTRADIDRVVVDGLSGGGYGAWRMAAAYPTRIAKIMPTSAAGSTTDRNNFVHVPIWFATGGKDPDPSPAQAQYSLNRMKEIGADIRYTIFPELGHSCWYQHWREPDFVAAMNDVHKANPLVFFQRNEFCVGEAISTKIGITPGFYAYEWQKDSVTIATRTNTTNTIIDGSSIISFTGNEVTVKAYGTYSVRFKRSAAAQWSAWSPKPAVIKTKTTTQTPPIVINGAKSKAIPAPDGSVTVPLALPEGFINYEWFRVSDNVKVASTQLFNAPAGVYKARYAEQYGCGTAFSPEFAVTDATGSPKPDPAMDLTTSPVSQTAIRLNWNQSSSPLSNETGFEIYRSLTPGGPYQFVALTATNIATFQDTGLLANTAYNYIVRAVNATGASANTPESPAKTLSDNVPPTAPSNLQYRGSTQTTATLKWTASTDNVGVKRYDIYANGVKLYSSTATSFTAINLDSLTTYSFTVKAVDNANNTSPASNQITAFTHRQGINYKYYNGTWTLLPNFTPLTPAKSGVMDTVSINTGIKTQTTKFAFLWEGYIYVPVAATYTFETISDDGTKLYLDVPYSNSATALVSNDGVHGAISKTGSKALTQGYHQITITYFQGVNGLDMQVYWSNNAGLAREMIPKNFFTFQSVSLGVAPAIPSGLTATATAYNKIRLNWNDNSDNETGFELVRSATSNGVFVPVGTAAANAVTFTDSGLAASTTYYYKIRSVGTGIESAYTAQTAGTTPAAPVTPAAPSQLDGQSGANNTISLNWVDNSANETGFRVYRSNDNINFLLLGSVPANGNAYTDLNAVALTNYYYYVVGVNASGEGLPSNTVMISAGNNAPVINSAASLFVKTDATASLDFTVTDDPGDNISVSIPGKPGFVTLDDLGGGAYRITVLPTVDNVGWKDITISASDGKGKPSVKIITVTVADKNTRSVYVKFGRATYPAPLPWNNWLGIRSANSTISNLKDETGVATGFSITNLSAWIGLSDLGHKTGNNSGIYPDTVLQGGISDNGTPKQIRINGLNQAKQYNLVFVGSRNEGITATTEYATGSQKDTLNARYNTNLSANLNNLIPDAAGQILVTITRAGTAPYSYLNAMVIEEYDPSMTLLNPANLYVEPIDRNSVSLSWSDRSENESPINGYELTRATDSLFSLNVTTINLNANVTAYTNTGLSPNTKYWYRVRATNGIDYSEYSNRVKTITPSSLVYVNFNTTVANASAPWNNLATPPTSVFTVNNLKNQSGAATNISMTMETPFNGEFTAGHSTGNNSGVVPDNVLLGNYWLDNSQICQIRVSGLNYSRRYRFGFIGSSSPNGWFSGNYTATYSINGRTVYLNSWQNNTKIVYIGDVTPDQSGQVLLNFSTALDGGYGFNSGFIIEEYTDTQGGTVVNTATTPIDAALNNTAAILPLTAIKAYPNPFSDFINLDFYNSAANNRISADVYDLSGRIIYRHNFDGIPAGHNTIRLSSIETKMGTGVYIIALKVNGKIAEAVKMIRKRN